MKLLAIDDKPDNLISLTALVRTYLPGCITATAQSGPEGIAQARAWQPDAILLDIQMPGMDGYETCQLLKTDSATRHIPVLFLTAQATDPASRIRGLEIGGDAFLCKPVDPGELMAQVRVLVRMKQAEDALRGDVQDLFKSSRDGIAFTDLDGCIVNANQAFLDLLGHGTLDALRGRSYEKFTPPEYHAFERAVIAKQIMVRGYCDEYEKEYLRGDGIRVWVGLRAWIRRDAHDAPNGMWAVVRDISERRRMEREHDLLQQQLLQAQKMESIGLLAGGVAHDYNNMLGVIIGHAELALMQTPDGTPVRRNLEQVLNAAQRSAGLTRQLLAFARKQSSSPVVLDLNDTVSGMLKMLQRLIGEDVRLEWTPGNALWPVRMDPSQVDQIMANLAVNARDAIAGVGEIAIATANVPWEELRLSATVDMAPRDYVRITVRDTGCGIAADTLSRIFDPFFTTKDVGKGTGLGLATVYGIVKQHGGDIIVTSAPGAGATFSIFLPRCQATPTSDCVVRQPTTEPRATATLLIVEDDPAILELSQTILHDLGYTVLTANTPGAALELARTYPDKIHLLISDVVMPDMHGRALSEQIACLQPDTKCLFMSGYTADIIARQGVLDESTHFLQKPFTVAQLAAAVRHVLETDALEATQA